MTYTGTLTAEHHQVIADIRDRLMAAGLSTKRADRAAAEAAVRDVYRTAGIAEPRIVIWMDSPVGGMLAAETISQLRGQLRDQLGGQLRDQLQDQLWDQLWDQLGDQLRGQLQDQLWDQLQDQLWDQLNGAIASGWWLTDYEYWLHIAQISGITPPDEATLSLARQAADMLTPTMIIPLRGVCIVVEQHTALHRDNRNRLHCTDGAAWAWADGTQIYALDGIRVPEWVVRRPDPKRIISDELPNTEQRRVAMAHYGWDRAVDDLNLKIIEASDNPVWGTLYALPETLVERGQATLLVCQNASPDRDGTVRTYGLLASSEARTVVAAQASLAQLSESEWLTLEGAS